MGDSLGRNPRDILGNRCDPARLPSTRLLAYPVLMICDHCQEEILDGEEADVIVNNGATHWHRECAFRLAGGDIVHQLGLCTCFVPHIGGPNCPCCHCTGLPDPEATMTRREAAREALRLYRERASRDGQCADEPT